MGKIGFLGGTFNPIHVGHINLAIEAYKSLKLDKVLIVPTGVSYLKSNINVLSKEIRAEMVKLAIEDYAYLEFNDIEIKKEGNTYTYETLNELHELYPNDTIYFICGADTLFNILSWKNPINIFNSCVLTVMSRDDKDINAIKKQADKLISLYNANIVVLECEKMDISSSDIREHIKNNDFDLIKEELPKKVFDYILDNALYF